MTKQIELLNQTANSNTQASFEAKDHTMLFSYQTVGTNEEKAMLCLFEYDEAKGCIKPRNYVIISQKIIKAKTNHSNLNDTISFYRTLSAVQEDPDENEVGSFSYKQGGLMYPGKKKSSSEFSKYKISPQGATPADVNSLEDVEEENDDQDASFSFKEDKLDKKSSSEEKMKEQGSPFHLAVPPAVTPNTSAKASMSTAKSSGAGLHFNEIGAYT